jgi:hypothetical protein
MILASENASIYLSLLKLPMSTPRGGAMSVCVSFNGYFGTMDLPSTGVPSTLVRHQMLCSYEILWAAS